MKIHFKLWYGVALIFCAVSVICLPFLGNPYFFDDLNFFPSNWSADFLLKGFSFTPRWWVYETLAATYVGFGVALDWLRFGNFLLHSCVSIVLVYFIRDLLRDIDCDVSSAVSIEVSAVLVAALFAVHPLSIFTQGYLVQRTVICATLFTILSLLCFWRSMSGSFLALLCFCVFGVIGMYAKEHAVMLPMAAFILLILRWRSGLSFGLPWYFVFGGIAVVSFFSLLLVLHSAGVLGFVYEPQASELLKDWGGSTSQIYPLSVLNQAGIFFNYLGLWVAYLPGEVSVDIKRNFPTTLLSWDLWSGAVAYLVYMFFASFLLWSGGVKGLIGFGFLIPGVMFFSEFSSVRMQETFVIYRSYLWAPFYFIFLAVVIRRIRLKVALLTTFLVFVFFSGLSLRRLNTFSNTVFVWLEAANVYENSLASVGVSSGYRIYYNLGTQLKLVGAYDAALNSFNRALELKPGDGYALNNRGSLYIKTKSYSLAQHDYEQAVKILPHKFEAWNGLANAYKLQGRNEDATKAWLVSCSLRAISPCPAL